MSFSKSSIVIIKVILDLYLAIWCDDVSRTCYDGRIGYWWCEVTLVSFAYVLMLVPGHLTISSATCWYFVWRDPVLAVILALSEFLRVQMSLWSWDPEYVIAPGNCLWDQDILVWPSSWDSVILWSCDPAILGMLEHLGVELPLCGVILSAMFAVKVSSEYWPRPEGTCATGQEEFLGAWVPLVPGTSSVGADVASSPPLIL